MEENKKTLEEILQNIYTQMDIWAEAWRAMGDNPHAEGRVVAMEMAKRLVEKEFAAAR